MNKRIVVSWNGANKTVRYGTKVLHLLTNNELKSCESGQAYIEDSEGHKVGLDGMLSDGYSLSLKWISPPK